MKNFILLILLIFFFLLELANTIRTPFSTILGNNIGVELYNKGIVTQTMKRPQHWFVNIESKKDNDKIYQKAEENGQRFQIQLLRENLDKAERDYERNLSDEKLRYEIGKIKLNQYNNYDLNKYNP
jgi:hypothetical protein